MKEPCCCCGRRRGGGALLQGTDGFVTDTVRGYVGGGVETSKCPLKVDFKVLTAHGMDSNSRTPCGSGPNIILYAHWVHII